MKPDQEVLSVGNVPNEPRQTSSGEHPFVVRLLELGATRRPPTDNAVPLTPHPMQYLIPDAPASLADISPPPLPQAFLALRRAAQNPMSTTADVAEVIALDPALSSYVLRLANSALYGATDKVETVSRAVARIGMSEIEIMAAAAMIGRLFEQPPRKDLLSMSDFWRHAVAVALLSRALGKRVSPQFGETLFVAGLLHDLGRLLLAMAEPDLAAATLARAEASGMPLDAAERGELGFDHAALCGRICAKWQLPETLAEAVACHHVPSLCPNNPQPAAVHLADFMANVLGARTLPAVGLPELDVSVLAFFDLENADPGEFLTLLEEGLASMTALFAP
jgi:HD-like signal output (HDOD) protein